MFNIYNRKINSIKFITCFIFKPSCTKFRKFIITFTNFIRKLT